MKDIEKLADIYLKGTKGYDPYYENDYCQNNYTDMRSAFEAGFRKARELAEKLWEHDDHCYCDFYGEGAKLLEKLGEKEVE